jgi:prohibitin 2
LLAERAAHFNIIIDNLAITDLTFMKEYLEAIESKQVAQQEA